MRRIMLQGILILGVFWMTAGQPPQAADTEPAWNMNATAIEACSCPVFCQCYFNAQPAEHSGHHGGETLTFAALTMPIRLTRDSMGW